MLEKGGFLKQSIGYILACTPKKYWIISAKNSSLKHFCWISPISYIDEFIFTNNQRIKKWPNNSLKLEHQNCKEMPVNLSSMCPAIWD
jgi:hypothetical protein